MCNPKPVRDRYLAGGDKSVADHSPGNPRPTLREASTDPTDPTPTATTFLTVTRTPTPTASTTRASSQVEDDCGSADQGEDDDQGEGEDVSLRH
jgi:hypothetical protein